MQRAGRSPLLIEKGRPGGLLLSANLVENYPGFPDGIRGSDLAELFAAQLKRVGSRITRGEVRSVSRSGGRFRIRTGQREYVSSAVLVATGTRPKETDLEGAKKLLGRLVFSEITDLPPKARSKRILIIGGGDAAFDYGLNLKSLGNRITILSRSEPSCLSLLRDRAHRKGVKVEVGVRPTLLMEDSSGLLLKGEKRGTRLEFHADYVLLACGRTPNIDILATTLRTSLGDGPELPETSIPGLYLLGDVARGSHRQTGIAVGDGIRAAMLANDFITKGRPKT